MLTCLLRVKNSCDAPALHMLLLPGECVTLSGPLEVVRPHASMLLKWILLKTLLGTVAVVNLGFKAKELGSRAFQDFQPSCSVSVFPFLSVYSNFKHLKYMYS